MTFSLIASFLLAACPQPPQLPQSPPLLRDDFRAATLDPAWTVHAASGNTVTLRDGALQIEARENTHAHLVRPLGADTIRASCQILAGNGISWATGLALYWRAGNWCQIALIRRADGRLYACEMVDGQHRERDLPGRDLATFQHVAIELAADGIRYLSSQDGEHWQFEHLSERPPSLQGPPATLVVGKGFARGGDAPCLDADYGDPGTMAIARVRDLLVAPLPKDRQRITGADRAEIAALGRDRHGEHILAGGEPDFARVAALFPPLRTAREALSVPDHPDEFGVGADGAIDFAGDIAGWAGAQPRGAFTIDGRALGAHCEKRLLDGHLPIVLAHFQNGPDAQLTAFAWSEELRSDRPLQAYLRLSLAKPAALAFALQPPPANARPLAAEGRELLLRLPHDPRQPAVCVEAAEFEAKLQEVRTHWRALLDQGPRITTPEPRVDDAYRAWLAWGYVDCDRRGEVYEPHDGAGFYEAVFDYSAALWCHALDLYGRHADAQRYLDSLLTFVRPDGRFHVNYGLPGMGALLFAMAQHGELSGDDAWLRRVAWRMQSICGFLLALRARSLAAGEAQHPLVRGLIRYRSYADYPQATVNYYGDAYSCIGLEATARVLERLGERAAAGRLAAEAAAYRRDILASMGAAVFERKNQRILPMEPETKRLLESTDYRAGSYYGVVASMLLESGFFPAGDPRAALVVDFLESQRGLILGMCEFDGGVDHAYTYGYWLERLRAGEPGRALLGFYGSLAYGMGRDTYCGVEVTKIASGEGTPTTPHLYSTTQQLRLLRMMLLREEGDELWLLGGAPTAWWAEGKELVVEQAPTRFGTVALRAGGQQGGVVVEVDGAARAGRLVLPLRLPGGAQVGTCKVTGAASSERVGDRLVVQRPRAKVRIVVRDG
ncbi:MAG: hypothetical protein FJ265_11690 [Planctomycetes bacterium]|nr:hypothetical protein [Planctomycetota bacterium]